MNIYDFKVLSQQGEEVRLKKFEGKVVRKDLVKLIKGNSTVQNFVLEYF